MPRTAASWRSASLLLLGALACGCDYSKEQLQEIASVKQQVLANPASVNQDNGHGTPLEVATLGGYVDLAEWLVQHGANLNALDREGQTALHYAAVVDHGPKLPMTRFMLAHGAAVDARRRWAETPLHVGISLGRSDVARLLLEHGADVGARTSWGQTPLHLASFPEGYPEIITLLLEHGSDINTHQDNGATPLHLAAMGHNPAIVTVLLQKGADPRLTDRAGATALHYAAQSGHDATARQLLASGADANALDGDRHTPLWRALHHPAITAGQGYSRPVDTAAVSSVLRTHGGLDR